MKKLTPQEYFFRYSYPCTNALITMKHITKKRYNEIEKYYKNSKTPSKTILQDTYKEAIRRIQDFSNLPKSKIWQNKIIKEYFLKEHNRFIDKGDGFYKHAPKYFKELCKVHTVIVKKVEKDYVEAIYKKKIKKVLNPYNLRLKPKDKVSIHFFMIIEKLRS